MSTSCRASVQGPVLERFGRMSGLNPIRAVQIRDSARYFEQTMIGAGREPDAIDRLLKQREHAGIGARVDAELSQGHVSVARDVGSVGEPLRL